MTKRRSLKFEEKIGARIRMKDRNKPPAADWRLVLYLRRDACTGVPQKVQADLLTQPDVTGDSSACVLPGRNRIRRRPARGADESSGSAFGLAQNVFFEEEGNRPQSAQGDNGKNNPGYD